MRALALIAIAVGCGGPAAPAVIPAEHSQPVQLELDLLSGGHWSSREAAGHVVVIDAWATYCKPCRNAFPKLNRLAAEHPDVVLIGVSVDEDPAVIRAFLTEVPASFPIAHDPQLTISRPPLAFTQLPSLVVLDREGHMRVRVEEMKESDYDHLPTWIAAVR